MLKTPTNLLCRVSTCKTEYTKKNKAPMGFAKIFLWKPSLTQPLDKKSFSGYNS